MERIPFSGLVHHAFVDKSLMFQKCTNNLLGWVVEVFRGVPGTVAPSFGPITAGICRYQLIIPDVSSGHGQDGTASTSRTCGAVPAEMFGRYSREVME